MGSILRFLRQVVGDKVDMFVDQHGVLNLQREGQTAQPVGMPAELIPALRPVIETQPSNVAVVPGADVDVALKVGRFNHMPFTVRWDRKSGSEWVTYTNSNSETFRITNVLATTQVRGVVTNAYGETVSDTITITPLEITQQPVSKTFVENADAVFSVRTNVPGASVQWKKVVNTVQSDVSGATAQDLTVQGLRKDINHGEQYVAVLRAGTGTITTNVVTLSVWTPDEITTGDCIHLDARRGVFVETTGDGAEFRAKQDDYVGTWKSLRGDYVFTASDAADRALVVTADSGNQVVRFNGESVLTLADSDFLKSAPGATVVAAVKINTLAATGLSTRFLQFLTSTYVSRLSLGETGGNSLDAWVSTTQRLDADSSIFTSTNATVHRSTQWAVITIVADPAYGGEASIAIFVDGRCAAVNKYAGTGVFDNSTTDINIGGMVNALGKHSLFRGDVGGMLIFNDAISNEDIRKCEEYLAAYVDTDLENVEFHL